MFDALLLEDPTAPDVPELCPFKYRVFFNCCPLKVSDYIVYLIKKSVRFHPVCKVSATCNNSFLLVMIHTCCADCACWCSLLLLSCNFVLSQPHIEN